MIGHRRTVDSTGIEDCVLTQDTVTLIRSQVRRCVGVLGALDAAAAGEAAGSLSRGDYDRAAKPQINWSDPGARAALAAELFGDASRSLGLSDDDIALIAQLADPEFEPAVMILLHFMLTVCEFYDHPLSAMYEFSSRGVAFASLQEANPLYGVEGNAALNIAKGAVALRCCLKKLRTCRAKPDTTHVLSSRVCWRCGGCVRAVVFGLVGGLAGEPRGSFLLGGGVRRRG
ncbi:hypothetical protein [Candidatus Poriferisodalis sp.]|uniref:hypothetical protein n=1 Tax=Candidatus Poriferisodalis sp. TaxID=3101277 RepID=UPI003B02DD1A